MREVTIEFKGSEIAQIRGRLPDDVVKVVDAELQEGFHRSRESLTERGIPIENGRATVWGEWRE